LPLREVSMPLSAVDCVGPAFEHMKMQLFRPFRIWQWTRLAFVGLLAGELSSGNSCGSHVQGAPSHGHGWPGPHMDPALLIPIAILVALIVPIVLLVFLYISSRMRFVLFDSVVTRKCEVRRMWSARGGPALYYFVWNVVFFLITFAGFGLIIGVPAIFAFANGWFKAPREHLPALILVGVIVFFLLLGWVLLSAVVHVFTKDFVVPQMALENITAVEGWGRLLKMLGPEKGRYIAYAVLKAVMAIAAAIAVGIAGVILFLLLLIPLGGVGVIWLLIGRAAGLGWNVFTITLAIVAGCILLFLVLYALSLVAVPVIVFFPAYSIYFFAARYPLLEKLVYPPPPPTPVQPPLVQPPPEPIG